MEDFYLDITDETDVYTINSYSNKERPVENQMRVHIKALSGKDINKITTMTRRELNAQLKGDYVKELWEANYDLIVNKWEFVVRIEKLENIKIKKGEEIIEITDPLTLYTYENTVLATIVQELQFHFIEMDNINLKN